MHACTGLRDLQEPLAQVAAEIRGETQRTLPRRALRQRHRRRDDPGGAVRRPSSARARYWCALRTPRPATCTATGCSARASCRRSRCSSATREVVNVDGGHGLPPAAAREGPVVLRHRRAPDADARLRERFESIAGDAGESGVHDHGRGPRDRTRGSRDGGRIWFEFAAICDGPRAQADYVEIARDFHTVLVSEVPRFDPASREPGAPVHRAGRRVLRPQRQAGRVRRGAA